MSSEMTRKLDIEEIIEEFDALTKNAKRVQRETLEKILVENGNTEYLQKWGLNGRTDPETFKECVPIVTHSDLDPYIQRILDGDSSPILTGKPIPSMSLSSGTTNGKPKFVPFTYKIMDITVQIYKTSFAYRNREYPISNGKSLQFIYTGKEFQSKGGVLGYTATTNLYRNPMFKATMEAIESPYCSPDEVILSSTNFQSSLYCHLLFGLIHRDQIQVIASTFAHSIVYSFRTFEQIWEQLCQDIKCGTLNSKITEKPLRTAVSKLLSPDVELADMIHKKCKDLVDVNWCGLIPVLFPNTKYLYAIMTGSMEAYCGKLRHYGGEKIALITADYAGSEGWIGVNVNPKLPPELATYAVPPNIAYFEFLPINECVQGVEPKALSMTEVKIGEEYEIIVTSFAGLYRYRMGDVVKVVGFHNSSPELRFVGRKNLLLVINIDKTGEKDLQISVDAAAKLLVEKNVEVVDFTSQVDKSKDPGHYVIFWELKGHIIDGRKEVLQECCDCMDRSFLDAGYMNSRKINSIGPLELRVVKKGTFQKILEHFVGLGSVLSVFKTPRCVPPTNSAVHQILCDNVVDSYFSNAYCS